MRSPIIFRKVCTKIIKTIAHNTKQRRPRFRKNQKLFFSKNSVSQDISNAGCKEPILPNAAFEKYRSQKVTLQLNKKHVLFHVERSQQNLKTAFFIYNQRIKPTRAQKDIFGTYSTSFWKFLFCSRNKSCFYKYSVSQDISNARCKEQKYQT